MSILQRASAMRSWVTVWAAMGLPKAIRDDARLHAATVGHKILASLNEPYTLKDQPHSITPSIGATLFNGDQTYPSNLLKEADTAMYQAKAAGRNTLCFYEKIELSRP